MKVNASPHTYIQQRHAQVTIPTTRNAKKYKMLIYTDLIQRNRLHSQIHWRGYHDHEINRDKWQNVSNKIDKQ